MRVAGTIRLVALIALVAAAVSCGNDDMAPTVASSITIGAPTPGPGNSIQTILRGSHFFVDRGSGALSIPITVTSGREVPYAALWVYLGTGPNPNDYCGQNLPDAPTWGPFGKGQTVDVTISGFQFAGVPCTVTTVRAYLHTRNNGALTPPSPSEIVVSATREVNLTFR